MLIECGSCRARYWMNETMMRGFKWAEVRCRRCSETIIVLTPMMRLETLDSADSADRAILDGDLVTLEEKPFPADDRGDRPLGRARHGSPRAETKAQPKPGLEEEADAEPVPDNVYPLALFREIRPKRLPIGGFDISGRIRPEPFPAPVKRKPAVPRHPPAPSPERPAPVPSRPIEKPAEWRSEGMIPSRRAPSFSSPTKADDRAKGSSPLARLRSRLSRSVQPHPFQIAVVYLVILILGGCGYLLVRYLSRLMSAAGG